MIASIALIDLGKWNYTSPQIGRQRTAGGVAEAGTHADLMRRRIHVIDEPMWSIFSNDGNRTGRPLGMATGAEAARGEQGD
ncbi:MAG: hypothetical protein M5R38_17315 [Candidatus Methylomirabilis sp.]|nr:hypothetical protein [Candidatus Methylomirabilis sp.]